MTDKKVNHKGGPKSLGSLLRYMEGMEIIVELKTGKRHRGILTAADEFMNLSLERSEEHPSLAKRDYNSSAGMQPHNILLDGGSIDIRGSNIRYIRFPDNADLTSTIKTGVERERAAANKYNRGKRK